MNEPKRPNAKRRLYRCFADHGSGILGASSIFTVNAFQGGQDRLTNAINIGQFDT
jgi:hypothetical protein